MVRYAFVAVAGMASMAIALPLNINLGAYSPALVVGDGEISFGGSEDVSTLMSVLEGAAVSAASGVAKSAGTATSATTKAAKAADAADVADSTISTSSTSSNTATTSTASTTDAKAAVDDDPTLKEQAQQIAKLQGLGKEITPRVQPVDTADTADIEGDVEDADDEPVQARAKRDLSGFDRALTFAEAALTKGPKIQLGTGVEGSGVGIIVDNNQVAAARAGKGATETTAARRRDVAAAEAPKRVRTKVTTMYVRSGVPVSLQSRNGARDLVDSAPVVPREPAVEVPTAVSASVSRRDAVDEVNLNVDGNQGLTMTFVETVEDGDDE